ncbi:MAG: flagellar hook-basal body complex protein FliE [Pseudomonadota bacterium]|nr:flagellar hook-basal body complex protein FliE [Pseudomonadota bacterium]
MSTIGQLTVKPSHAAKIHLNEAQKRLGHENSNDFGERISDAVRAVAKAQTSAAEITKSYELGYENDLSKVMVQQQISSLGFQLTLNVRNKLLSAYKDIMNMPV